MRHSFKQYGIFNFHTFDNSVTNTHGKRIFKPGVPSHVQSTDGGGIPSSTADREEQSPPQYQTARSRHQVDHSCSRDPLTDWRRVWRLIPQELPARRLPSVRGVCYIRGPTLGLRAAGRLQLLGQGADQGCAVDHLGGSDHVLGGRCRQRTGGVSAED